MENDIVFLLNIVTSARNGIKWLKQLSLFKSENERTEENIKQERIITYVYLILFASMFIFILVYLFSVTFLHIRFFNHDYFICFTKYYNSSKSDNESNMG